MATSTQRIQKLLKKSQHYDKDERFMSTSDLFTELQTIDSNQLLDPAITVPISRALLQQLDDASTDVQTVAVKCLGMLAKKLHTEQLIDVVDKLCVLIGDRERQESRDIYSIGMKTIVEAITVDPQGEAVGIRIVQGLTQALTRTKPPSTPASKTASSSTSTSSAIDPITDIEHCCLDILRELLSKFGSSLASVHELLLSSIFLPRLEHKLDSVRKRAIVTIGGMVATLSDRLFQQLMEMTITRMEAASASTSQGERASSVSPLLYTYLQTIGIISQSAGSRIGKYLPKIIPSLQRYCAVDSSFSTSTALVSDQWLELWENCLQAFEGIILRCPKEVTSYVGEIVKICGLFVSYDPNYNQNVEEEDEETKTEGGEGGKGRGEGEREGEEEDGGDWGDDDAVANDDNETEEDDNSWKVRRAALRCLSAFIRAKSDLLSSYYNDLMNTLISRFRERDYGVKLLVFAVMKDLLRETVVVRREGSGFIGNGNGNREERKTNLLHTTSSSSSSPSLSPSSPSPSPSPPPSRLPSSSSSSSLLTPSKASSISSAGLPVLLRLRSSYSILSTKIKPLISSSLRQIHSAPKHNKVETMKAVFELLKELIAIRVGQLDDYLNVIVPETMNGLNQEDVRVKIDALILLRLIVDLHSPPTIQPYLSTIVPTLIQSLHSSHLKIKTESLRLLSSLLQHTLQASNPNHQHLLQSFFYPEAYKQLQLNDIDTETKEEVLNTMAILLALYGDEFKGEDKVKECQPLFLARLTNELTRLSALRAITTIAESPLPSLSLSSLLQPAIVELTSFLRKDSTTLKQQTVITLTALIEREYKQGKRSGVEASIYSNLLKEVSIHINDIDLHLSHLVLELIISILHIYPTLSSSEVESILKRVLLFLKSPLVQGNALSSVVRLFQELLHDDNSSQQTMSYERLLELLLSAADVDLSLQSSMSIAQCIAAITKKAEKGQLDESVKRFVETINSSEQAEHHRQLALLVLGEIGRNHDMSIHQNLEQSIFSTFSSTNDNVKNAASFSLGNISLGNLSYYLPHLLGLIEKYEGSMRYLLLLSLKEIISRSSAAAIAAQTNEGRGGENASGSTDIATDSSSSSASSSLPCALSSHIDRITPLLFSNAENEAEGIRMIVAECIGGLAIISLSTILPKMLELLRSPHPHTRAVVITALRSSLAPHTAVHSLLQQHISTFLQALRDNDLTVRRQALLTVNALAHNNIELLLPQLSELILPILYKETSMDAALVRVVDLGPFQHKIDDGLPLRKASFQAFETIKDATSTLTNPLHRVEIVTYVRQLAKGLVDHDDVQIMVYEQLYKTALEHPQELLEVVEELPPPIMSGVREQLKEAKGEANPERAKDVLRVAVRCLYTISVIPGIEQCAAYVEFYQRVLKTALLAKMLEEMKQN